MKKPKLKFSRFLSAFALLTLFLISSGNIKAVDLIPGQSYTQSWEESSGTYYYMTKYDFTPSLDGVLTITLDAGFTLSVGSDSGGDSYGVYEVIGNDEQPISATTHNGEYGQTWLGDGFYSNVTKATWALQANHQYFVWFPYFMGTFTATMEQGSGGGDPVNPPTPENKVEDLTLPAYNIQQSQYDGYKFTANKTGVLTISYNAAPEQNLLYSNYSNGLFSENVPFAEGTTSSSEVQKWNVTAGSTYYLSTKDIMGSFSIEIIEENNPGGGTTGNPNENINIQFDVWYEITSATPLTGTLTSSNTGTLVASYSSDRGEIPEKIYSPIIFEDPGYEQSIQNIEYQDKKQVYPTRDYTTYYVYAGIAETSWGGQGTPFDFPYKVKFSLNDSQEPNPDIEWTELQLGQSYSNPPYNLWYQPESEGTMIAYQYGNGQGHFFIDEACSDPAEFDYSTSLEEPFSVTYKLNAGHKYYYRSEEVTSVTFEWKSNSTENPDNPTLEEIKLNTPYSVTSQNGLKGYFTPQKSGVLTADFTDANGNPINYGPYNEIVYGDANFSNVIGGNFPNSGVQEYALQLGNTYYINAYVGDFGTLGYDFNVIFSYKEEDENEEPPVVEIPDNYLPVILNHFYELEDKEELRLYLQPTSDGVLTILQWGTTDPHLWYKVNETPENYDGKVQESSFSGNDPAEYTYNLSAGKTYFFYGVYDNDNNHLNLSKVYFEYTGDMPSNEITVNIGDFNQNPILWNKEGIDFEGIISYPEGEEIDLQITIKPTDNVNQDAEPDAWSDSLHVAEWIWNLKEDTKSKAEIDGYYIDGYYKEPEVGRPSQNEDGSVDFHVLFGCSGEYKITVSSSNENVVFDGKTEQIIKVYPSIRNSYTMTSSVEGEGDYQSSLVINEMNIKKHNEGNMVMDYLQDENGNLFTGKYDKDGQPVFASASSELAKSTIFVRGLFFSNPKDGLYYKYDGMSKREARAAAADVDDLGEYNKVDGNGVIDLSGLSTKGTTNPVISFRIVKNGVDTGEANEADYNVALNFVKEAPTSVEGIEDVDNGKVVYYNLQGVKIDNPSNGIFIKVTGGKASKVLIGK